jgi:hypothetical protein
MDLMEVGLRCSCRQEITLVLFSWLVKYYLPADEGAGSLPGLPAPFFQRICMEEKVTLPSRQSADSGQSYQEDCMSP